MAIVKNKLLVLDYDGVLVDTRNEKLFSGFNAYLKLNPESRIFDNNPLTFENFEQKKEKFLGAVNSFFSMLDFVGIAGENACVFEIIENGFEITEYRKFKQFIGTINRTKYKEYHRTVLTLRQNYSEKFTSKYLQLSKPVNEVINSIQHLKDSCSIIICTMKPKENVVFLNKELGINNLFEDILTVDIHGKKIELIENFAQIKFIPEENVYFIDDHPSHLEGMHKSKINCYLADWGYNLSKNTFGFNIDNKSTISFNDFNSLIENLKGENNE